MRFAQPALSAMPAIHVHLRADEVPGLHRRNLFAHALHHAAKLMPQRQGRFDPSLRPAVPSVNVQIRSADRRRFHPHQNVRRANRRYWRGLHRQSPPRPHLPQRFHRRRHLLRSSLNSQSPMLAHPYLPNPLGHDTSCPSFSGSHFHTPVPHREISSKTNPFVRGPITVTTPATNPIATASIANTAGTPCTSTAPINIEVKAALNLLLLYGNPTPVSRSRVGNNSDWYA